MPGAKRPRLGGFLFLHSVVPTALLILAGNVAASFVPTASITLVIPSVLLGVALMVHGLRLRPRLEHELRQNVESAASLLTRDLRPPVLYLRAFASDGTRSEARAMMDTAMRLAQPLSLITITPTLEEVLARRLAHAGPVIAVQDPRDSLSHLGAARLRVRASHWQEDVQAWAAVSRLVVLRAGTTSGLRWELANTLATVPPERLVIWLQQDGDRNPRIRRARTTVFLRELEQAAGIRVDPPEEPFEFLTFGPDRSPRFLESVGEVLDQLRIRRPAFGARDWMKRILPFAVDRSSRPAAGRRTWRWATTAAAALVLSVAGGLLAGRLVGEGGSWTSCMAAWLPVCVVVGATVGLVGRRLGAVGSRLYVACGGLAAVPLMGAAIRGRFLASEVDAHFSWGVGTYVKAASALWRVRLMEDELFVATLLLCASLIALCAYGYGLSGAEARARSRRAPPSTPGSAAPTPAA